MPLSNQYDYKTYRDRHKAKLINARLCIWCGKNQPKETSKLCSDCTNKSIERRSRIATTRIRQGFCTQCLTKAPPAGYRLCDSCRSRKKRTRAKYLRLTYGLSVERYDALFASQQGRCAICNTGTKSLKVDHCHKTGEVRGLLCNSCNNGLGRFKDNAEALKRAAEYLSHWRQYAPAMWV